MTTDRPTKPAEIFAVMPDEVNIDKAKGIHATFQFELEGPDGGTWAVVVSDGVCSVENQAADSPQVTIKMSDQDFVALSTGELKAVAAFLSGKIRVYGDYGLATKLQVLFED
jgi:putative sterol carrier protein